MIRSVQAQDPHFRSVSLRPGFNLVIARRSPGATAQDSTNSLGKSSLVELLHFGLGSKPRKGTIPCVPALDAWVFSFEMELAGRPIHITRSVRDPNRIEVQGAPPEWGGERQLLATIFTREEWTALLGRLVFNLRGEPGEPGFRQLIRYFIRHRDGDFHSAFDHLEGPVWSQRVANAWLLGLAWRIPAAQGEIEKEKQTLGSVRKEASRGILVDIVGDRPVLEAERARLQAEIRRAEQMLSSFKVHERYEEIEQRASDLTERINRLSSENYSDERLLTSYRESVDDQTRDLDPAVIAAMYDEAGIWFPERVSRRLEEVQQFHETLLQNRRAFIEGELRQLEAAIADRRRRIAALDAERAELLQVLETHRALEHFSRLDGEVSRLRGQLAEVDKRLSSLEQLERRDQDITDRSDRLSRQAMQEHDERARIRETAQTLFSELVHSMYHEEGRLVLDDISPKFRFEPHIPSIQSTGVQQLATACVDLMLARLWAGSGRGPGLLVHDSRMFDGMDPRQRGATLARAFLDSEALGYRYLALLNEAEWESCRGAMPEAFDPEVHVRLVLHDHAPEGGLFGFRFG